MSLITQDLFFHFDAANTDKITASNGRIDIWEDEISNYQLVPNANANSAVYSSANQINGIDVPHFNGVDTQSLSTSWDPALLDEFTYKHQYFFLVLQIPHYATEPYTFFHILGNTNITMALTINTGGTARIASAGGNTTSNFAYPDNEPFILMYKVADSSQTYDPGEGTVIRVNKETLVDDMSGTFIPLNGLMLGSRGTGTDTQQVMSIGEMAYYRKSTAFTTSEIEQIENYLNGKWAVFNTVEGTITYGDGPNIGQPINGMRVIYGYADDETGLNFTPLEEVVTGSDGKHALTQTIPDGKVPFYTGHYKSPEGKYISIPLKIANSYLNA